MMGYVDNSYFPMSFATRIAKEKLYAKVDGEKVDLFKSRNSDYKHFHYWFHQ
jgi:hypothetical protein